MTTPRMTDVAFEDAVRYRDDPCGTVSCDRAMEALYAEARRARAREDELGAHVHSIAQARWWALEEAARLVEDSAGLGRADVARAIRALVAQERKP